MKYDFEECMRRLKTEIDSIQKQSIKNKKSNKLNSKKPDTEKNLNSQPRPEILNQGQSNIQIKIPSQTVHVTNQLKWTHDDVEKWFVEKNLNLAILNDLRPCDGNLLRQLFIMSITAPEFFYHSISSKKELSLRDAAMFSCELAFLFNQQ